MKKIGFLLLLVGPLLCGPCCRAWGEGVDRQPAVAGQFYPAGKDELLETLKLLYAKAVPPKGFGTVLAVIAPHAGYVYSGEVAASSFNQIDPTKEYENIFLLGPSHRVGFDGAAVYTEGDFKTPLGIVKVNTDLARRLIKENKVFVSRSDAHAQEHSLEVQLPFLQYRLKKNARIVPIVIGNSNPSTCKSIASTLRPYLTSRNLFVVSTDFSHYPSYEDARKVDKETADAITANAPDRFVEVVRENEGKGIPNLATCICGWPAVLTLLFMTQDNPGISYRTVQYKNSGDSPYGQKDKVVGYYAIAIVERGSRPEFPPAKLGATDKQELLALARNTILQYLTKKTIPDIDAAQFSPGQKVSAGAFVSLYKHGVLRGCIGRFAATEPLYKVVQAMAIAAATEDPRFPQVESSEVKDLNVEISVLSPMKRVNSISEIQLGRHGIYVQKGGRAGTFLPQVATEMGWSTEEFLGHCAQDKAGIGWNGWKDAEIYVYEAEVFGDKDAARR